MKWIQNGKFPFKMYKIWLSVKNQTFDNTHPIFNKCLTEYSETETYDKYIFWCNLNTIKIINIINQNWENYLIFEIIINKLKVNIIINSNLLQNKILFIIF